jgi:hypothetical protein
MWLQRNNRSLNGPLKWKNKNYATEGITEPLISISKSGRIFLMHSLGVFSEIQTHLRFKSTSKWKQEKSPQHSPSIFFKRNLVILGLKLYSISIQALFVAGLLSPEINQLKCILQNWTDNILKNKRLPTFKIGFSI